MFDLIQSLRAGTRPELPGRPQELRELARLGRRQVVITLGSEALVA